MSLPNTFIIGAAKCGTTALSHYLASHSDVFLPYPKEPSYWSSDLKSRGVVVEINSINDYLILYKNVNLNRHKIIIDASTRYIYSKVALKKILEVIPDAKFIVMLRNPIEMAQAYHMEKIFNYVEDIQDFETAWNMQDKRLFGYNIPEMCHEPKELQYKKIASLGTQLAEVKKNVPSNNIFVGFQEDMKANTLEFYKKVLCFLDLEYDGKVDFPILGSSRVHRTLLFGKIIQDPPSTLRPLIRSLSRNIKHNLPSPVSEAIKNLFVKRINRPKLDPEFQKLLVNSFREEIKLIESLTLRSLDSWLQK